MRKKLLLIVTGGLIAVSGFFGLQSAQADGYPANCGPSAVVKCGAYNQTELTARIQPDAQALYTKLGIGVNIYLAKNGVVYPDGTIKVDGKVVATDAMTYGRVKRNASDTTIDAGGTTFYKHSITGAAILRPVDAFVFLDHNGKFTGAVIKMCGNPVVAVASAKPEASCDLLSVDRIERTKFKFTAKASTKDGAKITGYSIVVKRGSTTVDTINITSASNSVTQEATYSTPGDYSAEVTVKTTLGDKRSDNCKTTFTVDPEPIAMCKTLTKTITNRSHYRLDAKASVENGATISGYRYEIKNTSDNSVVVSKTINSTSTTSSIEGDLPAGSYAASVVVLTSLGEKNGAQCATTFEIEEEPKDIKVCDLDSKEVITIKETEFDASKHSEDLRDCLKDIKVCDLDSMKVITIKEDEFDASKHSEDVRDCVKDIEVCELDSKTFITIKEDEYDTSKHSKDPTDCDTEVCNLDSKEVITIRDEDFDASKHSRDLRDCIADIEVCELDSKTFITIKEDDYVESKHSTDPADCDTEVCDLDSKEIITIRDEDFDGSKHSRTLSDCDEPESIRVCELESKTFITIKEDEYDESKHSKDAADCDTEVCDLDSKEIITIRDEDFDGSKHSRTLSDCDVVMVKVCDLNTNTIIEVDSSEVDNDGYTTDLSQCEKIKVCDPDSGDIITVFKSEAGDYEDEASASCKTKPPATELPETGLADTLGSILGLGSLTAATYYYATSRRS